MSDEDYRMGLDACYRQAAASAVGSHAHKSEDGSATATADARADDSTRQRMLLWDGTAARPWNRMIFAPQSSAEARQPAPAPIPERPEPKRRCADRLRVAMTLRGVWFTSREAAMAAGISQSQAASSLNNLTDSGDIAIDRKARPNLYRWTS